MAALQCVLQFSVSFALVGSSAGGWYLPVTGCLLSVPGLFCMVLSIGDRHNVSIGHTEAGVEVGRVLVVIFALVGVLGAASSLFSSVNQKFSPDDVRSALWLVLIASAPARIAE